MGKQELHQLDVAGLRSPQEGRRAAFIQPLIGEHGARFRAVGHPGINFGAFREEQLDVFQVIHVRRADRIVSSFDVAVVRRQVKGSPAALVGKVRVGALFKQVFAELVEPVLRCDEQGTPAVAGHLIDIGSGIEQHADGFEAVCTCCIDQRCQLASIGLGLPAAATAAGAAAAASS